MIYPYPFFSGLKYLYGLGGLGDLGGIGNLGDRFRSRTVTPGFGGNGPLTTYTDPFDNDGDNERFDDTDHDYRERSVSASASASASAASASSDLPGFSGFGGFIGGPGGPGGHDAGRDMGPSMERDMGGHRSDSGSVRDSDPFAPDRDSRRRAINMGLMAAGLGLMEGAGTGDMTGGIARALAGFSQARDASLDRDRSLALQAIEERRRDAAERRADAAESRAAAQETDRDRMADVQYDTAAEGLSAARDARTENDRLREATGRSANQMVTEINSLAAAHPKDETLQLMAKSAVAYSLGPDSNLGKLDALYSNMAAYVGRDAAADWERRQAITTAEAQAHHGYGPIAEGRRSEVQLGYEGRRLNLYGQQAADQMNHRGPSGGGAGSGGMPSVGQQADDIRQEANTIYSTWLQGRMKGVGELVLGQFNPDGSPVRKQPPSADEIAQARAGALLSAQRSYETQLKALRGDQAATTAGSGTAGTTGTSTGAAKGSSAGSASLPPPVFHYDPKTGTMLRAFPSHDPGLPSEAGNEDLEPLMIDEARRNPHSRIGQVVEQARRNKTRSPNVDLLFLDQRPHGPNAPGAGVVAPDTVEYADPLTPIVDVQRAKDQAGNPISIYSPRARWEGAPIGIDNPRSKPAAQVIDEADPILHMNGGDESKDSWLGKIGVTINKPVDWWHFRNDVADYVVKPRRQSADPLAGLSDEAAGVLTDRLNAVAESMNIEPPIAWDDAGLKLLRAGGTDADLRALFNRLQSGQGPRGRR